MVYTGFNWLKPQLPVGSPNHDGEADYVSENEQRDIEADRTDNWREELLGK